MLHELCTGLSVSKTSRMNGSVYLWKERNVTYSNCFFSQPRSPEPKDSSFPIIKNKDKQQILMCRILEFVELLNGIAVYKTGIVFPMCTGDVDTCVCNFFYSVPLKGISIPMLILHDVCIMCMLLVYIKVLSSFRVLIESVVGSPSGLRFPFQVLFLKDICQAYTNCGIHTGNWIYSHRYTRTHSPACGNSIYQCCLGNETDPACNTITYTKSYKMPKCPPKQQEINRQRGITAPQ